MLLLEICVALSFLATTILAGEEGAAQIIQYDYQRNGNAQYKYSYETSNGIKINETGDEIPSIHDASNNAALVKGAFSYTGADGVVYAVNYVADEAGFHPEGAHLRIPPFTPWIPGTPVDDGQYTEDKSGNYKPDNSGKYSPEEGEKEESPFLDPKQDQDNYISGERILNAFRTTTQPPTSATQKYLPTRQPQKTNYISGENILDTFLSPKKIATTSPPVTPKYLPASSTPQIYTSGENILDAFRESSRPTPKYLPSYRTEAAPNSFFTTENPLSNDILKKAFFNKPTPHPDILLHSTPNDRQTKIVGLHLQRPFEAATQNKPTYVKFSQPKNEARGTRSFQFPDINPDLRLLAGLI